MAQNVYDQPDFFEGYSRLSRSVHGLAGAPEWPMLRSMLPDLAGRRVVDLGCGFGWFCRWARENGAAHVLGLDLSEKMLDRARMQTKDAAVAYAAADLEDLSLPKAGFDLVHSSLAFHYVENAARLFATIHRALLPGAHLVFSTEHPIFMAPSKPGWLIAQDGRKSWPIDRYFVEGRRETDWLSPGVVKYHRTIGTTLGLLLQAGFRIEHVKEFCPDASQIAANPALREEIERPMFLLNATVAAAILESVFGAVTAIPFTATDVADRKRTRQFKSIADMVEEHKNVRVWGGVHFRTGLDVSVDMGRKVAAYMLENSLKPAR